MSNALTKIAEQNSVTPEEVADVLRGMIISGKGQHGATATNAEMTVVSSIFAKYDLNPFIREGHAFISGGKLQVMIGLDGWLKIANRNPDFDGYEQEEIFNDNGDLLAVKTKIYVKGRRFPTPHTEWMKEAFVSTSPAWKKYPFRMLAGKSLGQCVRKAFGISEVLDDDEANRITGNAQPMKDITPQPEVDLKAISEGMHECETHESLNAYCANVRQELGQSFDSVKAELMLMKREAEAKIDSNQSMDEIEVPFDPDTGEVLDEAQYTDD